MPDRSPHAAIQAYLEPLNLVVSCVSSTPVRRSVEDSRTAGRIGFPAEEPIRLRGKHGLSLNVLHAYEVVDEGAAWSAHTRSYLYHVYARDGREFIAFHWHPRGAVRRPHAHFRTLIDPLPLGRAHIPTGRTSLEAVVRLLIEELAVEPIRPDWRRVLAVAEGAFVARRTWHTEPPIYGGSEPRRDD